MSKCSNVKDEFKHTERANTNASKFANEDPGFTNSANTENKEIIQVSKCSSRRREKENAEDNAHDNGAGRANPIDAS